jgi:hypothetical protein
MVLREEITGNGIVPLPDWIARDRLVAELAASKIKVLVHSKVGESQPRSGKAKGYQVKQFLEVYDRESNG